MKRVVIKSIWGEMDNEENEDGVYIINYPDDSEPYGKVIDQIFKVLDSLRGYNLDNEEVVAGLSEEEQEAYKEMRSWYKDPTPKVEIIDYISEVPTWFDNRGCSLGAVLDMVVHLYPSWSYEKITVDNTFDVDNGTWKYE